MSEEKPIPLLKAGSLGLCTIIPSSIGPKIKEYSKKDLMFMIENLGEDYHFLTHIWEGRDYMMIEILREKKYIK